MKFPPLCIESASPQYSLQLKPMKDAQDIGGVHNKVEFMALNFPSSVSWPTGE
jgi:hypothetical protein